MLDFSCGGWYVQIDPVMANSPAIQASQWRRSRVTRQFAIKVVHTNGIRAEVHRLFSGKTGYFSLLPPLRGASMSSLEVM